MNRFILVILSFTILLVTSCSHSPVRELNYKKYNVYSSEHAGNLKFEEIGPVYSSQSTWIFGSCKEQANAVLMELIENAKDLGGDAVINVKWRQGDRDTAVPACKTAWGWAALPPILGLLLPWTKNVTADGTAINILEEIKEKNKTNSNVLYIPSGRSIRSISEEYLERLGME